MEYGIQTSGDVFYAGGPNQFKPCLIDQEPPCPTPEVGEMVIWGERHPIVGVVKVHLVYRHPELGVRWTEIGNYL